MINIKQLLDDYSISYWEEGNNVSKGWVNIQCPLCNDISNHGGFNVLNSYYNCWICGHHRINDVLTALLDITWGEANALLDNYATDAIFKNKNKKVVNKKLKYPVGINDLHTIHKKYLINRNFDPEKLEKIWGLKGTMGLGNYNYRIIAPITLSGRSVSYIGRDITNKSPLRYKTCSIQNEVIHHKYILYGMDYIRKRKAIIVEGMTDVWRLGKGAIALFGKTYTKQQILEIVKNVDTAFIVLDADAGEQSIKLCSDLVGLIKYLEIIKLDVKDPAELSQNEADYLNKLLLRYDM